MKIVLISLFLILNLNHSWAVSDEQVKQSIEEILKVRHPTETGDWWKSLGPNAPKVISKMISADSNIYHQIRLIDALGWYDDPIGTETMKKIIETEKNPTKKGSAVHSFIQSQGLKEKKWVSKLLNESNPQTREAAARALIESNNPDATNLVDEHLKTEKVKWLVNKLRAQQMELKNSKQNRTPARIQRQ